MFLAARTFFHTCWSEGASDMLIGLPLGPCGVSKFQVSIWATRNASRGGYERDIEL